MCKECGRTREHFTEYVLVDVNSLGDDDEVTSEYDAHILDHEVECPKCGSLDRYELGPLAHLRLASPDEILAMFQTQSGEKPNKFKSNPRVLYFRPVAFGEIMHPLDGLDEYRRRIALHPDDALLYARMGSLLRILMRYSEALDAQRHAYQLAPDDPEIILRLALSEHDLGDKERAQKLYRKIIEHSEVKSMVRFMDDHVVAAMKGLQNLKRHQPSPAEINLTTSDGEPVEHPSMSWRHQQERSQSPPSPKKSGKKTKRGRRGRRKK
jgi:tetratricopeptide (TPR) repeat protein